MNTLDVKEIARLSLAFEAQSPQAILKWAVETFCPDLAASSVSDPKRASVTHDQSNQTGDAHLFSRYALPFLGYDDFSGTT